MMVTCSSISGEKIRNEVYQAKVEYQSPIHFLDVAVLYFIFKCRGWLFVGASAGAG